MIFLFSLVAITSFLLLFPLEAKAFVILPTLILIPIAKIIALIVGGFTIPTLGLSAFVSKITGKSYVKGIVVGVGILLIVSIILVLILKMLNPSRPLI